MTKNERGRIIAHPRDIFGTEFWIVLVAMALLAIGGTVRNRADKYNTRPIPTVHECTIEGSHCDTIGVDL